MMGATLPLVIKSAVAREDRVGGRIGLLYAINTTGAIAGALVAGFYFISEIGVARSFQIAAATNIADRHRRDRGRLRDAAAVDRERACVERSRPQAIVRPTATEGSGDSCCGRSSSRA